MHNKDYLYGQFFNYGIQKFFLCSIGFADIGSIWLKWRQFALEETRVRNGKVLKKLNIVYKKTYLHVMLDYSKLKLQHFVKHNF